MHLHGADRAHGQTLVNQPATHGPSAWSTRSHCARSNARSASSRHKASRSWPKLFPQTRANPHLPMRSRRQSGVWGQGARPQKCLRGSGLQGSRRVSGTGAEACARLRHQAEAAGGSRGFTQQSVSRTRPRLPQEGPKLAPRTKCLQRRKLAPRNATRSKALREASSGSLARSPREAPSGSSRSTARPWAPTRDTVQCAHSTAGSSLARHTPPEHTGQIVRIVNLLPPLSVKELADLRAAAGSAGPPQTPPPAPPRAQADSRSSPLQRMDRSPADKERERSSAGVQGALLADKVRRASVERRSVRLSSSGFRV